MFDLHYDLLTICYLCYLKNDFSYLEELARHFDKGNIKGVVANLYFMGRKQMEKELGANYFQDDTSVVEMFEIATLVAKKYFCNILLLFSIEGCDYLEIEDLEPLYKLGLRNILPVWNNKNKYGSGNGSDSGLTDYGKRLIDKAISLHISIDLSHANKKTFYEMIHYLKEKKQQCQDVFVMASHSNCRKICDVSRNLDDDQILMLKDVDGLLGVVMYKPFIYSSANQDVLKQKYLEHINRVIELIGIDSLCVSSDNMSFLKNVNAGYVDTALYQFADISKKFRKDLSKYYTEEEINKICYSNFKKRYDKLKESI